VDHARPQPPTPRPRRPLSLLLALAATTPAISCSHHPTTVTAAHPPTSATPSTPDAPAAPPGDTCARFAIAALSSDTTIDHNPGDARQRAAQQFGSAGLANHLAGAGNDQTWPAMVTHSAHIVVDATPINDDPPASTTDHAGAGVLTQRTALAPDGWRQQLPTLAVYCTLANDGSRWAITAITMSDASTGSPSP
jgi:hypothetical protein